RSPTRTGLAGFAVSSLTSTLPPAHAAAARLRVLKKRAAQSHLSTRSESGESVTPKRYHRARHDLGDLHEIRAGPRLGHSPPPRRPGVGSRRGRRRGLDEPQARRQGRARRLDQPPGKGPPERRRVVEDYTQISGEAPENPGAVSVAIDSDDTNSSAESFFGAIIFTKP